MIGIPLYFFIPLAVCIFMCLYRIARGPTLVDKMIGIDFLNVVLIGYCSLLAFYIKRPFLLDISLVLAILNFVGTLTLAKYLEGRKLDK
ncbi:MAG: cation:proton antiporter [bacterium]|nr:cation:proton antiporter [bacterium]